MFDVAKELYYSVTYRGLQSKMRVSTVSDRCAPQVVLSRVVDSV